MSGNAEMDTKPRLDSDGAIQPDGGFVKQSGGTCRRCYRDTIGGGLCAVCESGDVDTEIDREEVDG